MYYEIESAYKNDVMRLKNQEMNSLLFNFINFVWMLNYIFV